ncbi:MAG: DUF3291 domain-containing protein [Bacteroidota bacterium]
MFVTITSLELKSPLKFFALSLYALRIINQLKNTPCVDKKTNGVWTKHYTMTLWKTEEDLKTFAKQGAHLEAMRKSGLIAKQIRILTYQADKLPDWKTAKQKLLTEGRVYNF